MSSLRWMSIAAVYDTYVLMGEGYVMVFGFPTDALMDVVNIVDVVDDVNDVKVDGADE